MDRPELIRDLSSRITAINRSHPVRVAIDGPDAAGKTMLADELAAFIGGLGRSVIRASIDGFHNPAAIRHRRGPMSPEGFFHDSFDYQALVDVLLRPLGPGGSLGFRRAVFDFRADAPVDTLVERAAPGAILLFDGVFLLRPELRDHFDFSVFLRADFSATLARAEVRDLHLFGTVDEIRRRYNERYVPGQRIYFSSVEPGSWASVVVDNNDPQRPIIEPAG
jgi:uridine kinase